MSSLDGGGSKADAGDAKPAVHCADAGGGTKGRADSCSCGSECQSGYCVSGLCCDSACTDGCKACNLPSSLGICAFVPAGVNPTNPSFCAAETPSTCGRDGTCDGVGACRKYEDGTLCKNGTCDGDGVVNAKGCDGKGSCSVDVNVPCAPYTCDPKTSQCAEQCLTSALCAAGQTCSAGRCGFKLNGFKCSGDDDCASGHCADGYCCNVACTGACLSCNEPGALGNCKLIGAGVPDSRCAASDVSTCETTGLCDGAGACALFPENTPCGAASCAANVTQNTARVCDGQGTCRDAQVIDCAPFLCSKGACNASCLSDADCESGHQCVASAQNGTTTGTCGQKKPGVSCKDASDCESKQCVDGVCCESACSGACRSCNLPGSPGRCLSVAAGAADPRNGCKDLGKESCGTDGLCDGAGGCQMYAAGTVCGIASCVEGAHTLAATCNQSGQCVTPPSLSCNPYLCNGASCFNACANDTQCVTGNSCVNGSCGLIPNGGECSTGSKCQSGHCAQGVCCNSDCTDACMACNLTSSLGKCTAVADNSPDPQEKCKVTLQNTCGNTGACKAGVCANWDKGKNCAPAACATNTSATPASACDGAGKCVTPNNNDCGNYICSVANRACNNSCQSDGDCRSPNTCSNGSCGVKNNGSACTTGNQCASGFCTEGVCCDSACSDASTGGLCKSCKVSGNVGKCSNVASGQSDPKQRCAASNPGSGDCTNDGTCNGNGACRPWLSIMGCRQASCTGHTLTAAANCDGAGHCPASATSDCAPFQCNSGSASCLTTCTSDGNCFNETCLKTTNRCGNKLANGGVCVADTDCNSGHCVSGTCCQTACVEKACGIKAQCLANGSACQTHQGETCGSATCSSDAKAAVGVPICDGTGNCVPPSPSPCTTGYLCSSAACLSKCSATTDCSSGYQCVGTACKLNDGQTCTSDGDCANAHCVNNGAGAKVCCNSACSAGCSNGTATAAGTCAAGTCTPGATSQCAPFTCNSSGVACLSSCSKDGDCALAGSTCASGACKKPNGQACSGSSDCSSGNCVGTGSGGAMVCCNSACSASCSSGVAVAAGTCAGGTCTPGLTKQCAPYTCSGNICGGGCKQDSDCASTNFKCDTTSGACLLIDGQQCTGPADCYSGNCVAGTGNAKLCCNSACSATCLNGVANAAGTCSGGTCTLGGITQCSPYVCGSNSCKQSCAGNGDCASGYACSSGVCKAADGQSCSADGDCAHGHCAGSVCCATACTTTAACSNNSSVPAGSCATGTCSQPAALPCGPYVCSAGSCKQGCTGNGDCASGYECSSGGVCKTADGQSCSADGDCANGHCVGSVCCATACSITATCSNNSSVPAGSCATGACSQPAATPCGPYVCSAGSCKQGCTGNGDCASGYACSSGGACKTADGQSCSADGDCANGHCVGNVCCATACSTSATCSNDSVMPAGSCSTGTCSQPAAIPCSPYTCSGGACLSQCTTSTDCAAGLTCSGTTCS